MKYPVIKVPRKCFVVFTPNQQSPRIQLSGKDKHLEWVKMMQSEAEDHCREHHSPRNEEVRFRMFWRTVSIFLQRLQSGLISVQVWQIRGEMSKLPSFSDEAFTVATKNLFKVS